MPYIMKKTGGKYPLFSDGSGGFNQPWKEVSDTFNIDTINFAGVWSLRKVISTATQSIRIRRSSDNAETDIGFVGPDLDEAAINSFCTGSNCFIERFYDQSGSNNPATFSYVPGTNIGAKIYDTSTGLLKTDGKVSCRFHIPSPFWECAYGFNTVTMESTFFVASNVSTTILNYVLHGPTGDGITINTTYWNPKLGTVRVVGGEFGRGLSFSSGRNLASFVYSATASLYMINRNGGADTFGDLFGGSQNANTTLPRFTFNRLSRVDNNLGIRGDFQELLIAASGSNANLATKNDITNNINNYWQVY
jgi:hypothetical protein